MWESLQVLPGGKPLQPAVFADLVSLNILVILNYLLSPWLLLLYLVRQIMLQELGPGRNEQSRDQELTILGLHSCSHQKKHNYCPLEEYTLGSSYVNKLDGVGPVDNRPSTD